MSMNVLARPLFLVSVLEKASVYPNHICLYTNPSVHKNMTDLLSWWSVSG